MLYRLLMSSGFAVDLRTSRVQRLDGLGSLVTEWKPNEPLGLLMSSGFAVDLRSVGSGPRDGIASWDPVLPISICDLVFRVRLALGAIGS